MHSNSILDHHFISSKNPPEVWRLIRWWESKRSKFNTLLVMSSVIVLGIWGELITEQWGECLIGILLYLLLVNLLYTLSWGVEIMIIHYLGQIRGIGQHRNAFFTVVSLFFVLTTIVGGCLIKVLLF